MFTIQQKFRSDYQGEDAIVEFVLQDGVWWPRTEFMPNTININRRRHQAVVIGNGVSRTRLAANYHSIMNMQSVFGPDAILTYGCNALYRDYSPVFLVAHGDAMTQEIVESGYAQNHQVYSSGKHVYQYGPQLHLIPQNPEMDAGAIAAYLACFDQHRVVYLMGFDTDGGSGQVVSNIYAGTDNYPVIGDPSSDLLGVLSLASVASVYTDVEFVRVMPRESFHMPEQWRYLTNFRQIEFRQFIQEIGL